MSVSGRPYKVAIVGGIGSGKSVVSRLFRLMGVPVYDCDSQAKRLMNSDAALRLALIEAIDGQVYVDDGTVNRSYLASYMFGYPERIELVNGVVHPAVRADFDNWVKCKQSSVVAVESAILFESGMDADVDAVIFVYAPMALRVRRAMERDRSDEDSINRRMKSQMDDVELRNRVSYVIVNDGTASLITQVRDLINLFTANQVEL